MIIIKLMEVIMNRENKKSKKQKKIRKEIQKNYKIGVEYYKDIKQHEKD